MSSAGRSKVLVAMSGGVDSSVAAALLRRAGHEVVGCFMRLGTPGETLDELTPGGEACDGASGVRLGHRGCCSVGDAADARSVAALLGIPFYVVNFRAEFGRIIDYFVDEYAAGRTPNPCVRCNDWLKFGKLHEYARQIGAGCVASGHYARIEGERLYRGLDERKDQSYVLFGIPREQLASTLLPVGGMDKPRVRDLARELGLPVHDKPDSQEICFVPDDDYAGLVESRRPELARAGPILDEEGAVIGQHGGQHRFTVGQRRGLTISLPQPRYVVRRDASSNAVVVGPRERLASRSALVGEANWHEEVGREWFACRVKYRYNTPDCGARARVLEPSAAPGPSGRRGRFEVAFDAEQGAVAPGQALVLYATDGRVVGGGWIESAT